MYICIVVVVGRSARETTGRDRSVGSCWIRIQNNGGGLESPSSDAQRSCGRCQSQPHRLLKRPTRNIYTSCPLLIARSSRRRPSTRSRIRRIRSARVQGGFKILKAMELLWRRPLTTSHAESHEKNNITDVQHQLVLR